MSGPLEGTRIIEIRAMGPLPFAGMLLSDMGADVVRIDRPVQPSGADGTTPDVEVLGRGRRSIIVDLKHSDGPETVLSLVDQADALIEGFRPGVMERLGLGPDVCRQRNQRLVYGRMTGWGQEGPLAHAAGHDINYISLAGALEPIGRRGEAPVPPLNLVGDFGGGGMLMAFGVVCGILRARATGQGQVIDAAMVDGAALLSTFVHEMSATGEWAPERGTNLIDTGAPYYEVYETSDAKYVSVGALEEGFHDVLTERLGGAIPRDRASWPEARRQFTTLFATKTRDEWCDLLEGSDSCFAPVLSPEEARAHPHNRARQTFIEVGGVAQPGPAPRFSDTPGSVRCPGAAPGSHTDEVLAEWGLSTPKIAALHGSGAVR